MPHYQHDDFGDVQNYIFAKGIITAVDVENDLADVTVEGYEDGSDVPLFYHCEPDSEERSNGAIEGAASAFSFGTKDDPADGDEVIVMLEVGGDPIRIVGFVDGIKECAPILVVLSFTYDGTTYYTIWDVEADQIAENIGFTFPCDEDTAIEGGSKTCKEWINARQEINWEQALLFSHCAEDYPWIIYAGGVATPRCDFGEFEGSQDVVTDSDVEYYPGGADMCEPGTRTVAHTEKRHGAYFNGDHGGVSLSKDGMSGPFRSVGVKDANGESLNDRTICQQIVTDAYNSSYEIDSQCTGHCNTGESYIVEFKTPLGDLPTISENIAASSGWTYIEGSGSHERANWKDFNRTGMGGSLIRALWTDNVLLQVYFYDAVVRKESQSYAGDEGGNGCLGPNPTWSDWSGSNTRYKGFAAAIDFFPDGDAKDSDPLDQTKHSQFTSVIEALHQYVIEEESVPDDKVVTHFGTKFI